MFSTASLLPGAGGLNNSGLSRDFLELVKAIGEARSKQEEDRIIIHEISVLKTVFQNPAITKIKLKECLVRALYAEMLGHDASFSHIFAVNLASDKNLVCKRTAYTICGLCLKPDDELVLLLINTIQKDLASSDYMEVAAALNYCSQAVHREIIPILLPSIMNLLFHSKSVIRKKAVCALQALYSVDSGILENMGSNIKRMVHDLDMSVVSATCNLIRAIFLKKELNKDMEAIRFCREYEGLVPSLVSILKNLATNKIAGAGGFYGISEPWIQIKIINILALICGQDQAMSEEVYEVLRILISRCDLQVNVSYAIAFECIKTIASIYPLPVLCQLAATTVAKFIESDNRNLHNSGLTGLAYLVKLDVTYVTKHEMAIIDFLDDKDETIRTKALELLATTTNSSNVTAVVEQLLKSATTYIESQLKLELVARAVDLTERFSPNPTWFLETMSKIFLEFSEFVPIETANEFFKVVNEGPTGIPQEDSEFRRAAVRSMLSVLEKMHNISESALRASTSVVGIYGYQYQPEEWDQEDIFNLLIEAATITKRVKHIDTRGQVIFSLLCHAAALFRNYSVGKNEIMDACKSKTKSLLDNLIAGSDSMEWDPDLAQMAIEFTLFLDTTNALDIYADTSRNRKFNLRSIADYTKVIENCVDSLKIHRIGASRFGKIEVTPPSAQLDIPAPNLKLNFEPYKDPPACLFKKLPSPVKTDEEQPTEFQIKPAPGRWSLEGLNLGNQVKQQGVPEFKLIGSTRKMDLTIHKQTVAQVDEQKLKMKRKVADQLFAGVLSQSNASSSQASKLSPLSKDMITNSSSAGVKSSTNEESLVRLDDVGPVRDDGDLLGDSHQAFTILEDANPPRISGTETADTVPSIPVISSESISSDDGLANNPASGETMAEVTPRATVEQIAAEWAEMPTEYNAEMSGKANGWNAAEVLGVVASLVTKDDEFKAIQVSVDEGLATAKIGGKNALLYCQITEGEHNVKLALRTDMSET